MWRFAAALLVAAAGAAHSQPIPALQVAGVSALDGDDLPHAGAPAATHRVTLTLYAFRDSPWGAPRALQAVREAAPLFAQCGVRLDRAEFRELDGGRPEWRDLFTPLARELVRELQPAKPAVFLVGDTRNRPAFDGEAFGRGNTRTRPELAGTVWLTARTRDLPVALAHELAHVLMDSGEHSEEPGNLMREDTAPENSALTPAQCGRMREQGTANGWLQPVQ